MNRDKHIWEGWTVGDFIDDIEPVFNMCAPFHDKQSLKRWVAQEQPYYKKHIPEVYNYFLKKSGLFFSNSSFRHGFLFCFSRSAI